MKRTYVINVKKINQNVVLFGWIETIRDHGGVIFVDLRDNTGIIQLVFRDDVKLKVESVLYVSGRVRKREQNQINESIITGQIEVVVEKHEVLNISKSIPFEIKDSDYISELNKLKYRYIYLRNENIFQRFKLKHNFIKYIREFLNKYYFLECDTPILNKFTPEGSREFFVPSRLDKGKYYVLPQSPQIFKQILMVSGFDRYYQICKCFRDEDLRSDRQFEFLQADIEMSFMKKNDIIKFISKLLKFVIKKTFNINFNILKMTHAEAIKFYGSDKPDLRYDSKIKDITKLLKNSECNIFKNVIKNNGKIKCIKANKPLTRKELDDIVEKQKQEKRNVVWIRKNEKEFLSPISKFLNKNELNEIFNEMQCENGVIFIAAEKEFNALTILGEIRTQIDVKIKNYAFVWIVDFPLFEWNEDKKQYVSVHNPFSKPIGKVNEKSKSETYDIVLNGVEIGGGAIRINSSNEQRKIFKFLRLKDKEIEKKFGHFLKCLEYGAPPHGGIALGIERILQILINLESIKDVILFPKTQTGYCPLTNAPSVVEKKYMEF